MTLQARSRASKGKAKGKGKGAGGFPGRGGRSGETIEEPYNCNFCGLPWHMARQCRLLHKTQRFPNTTAEQHAGLDKRRDDIFAKLPARDQAQFKEFMTNQVGASLAATEARFAFPDIDGKSAQICEEVEMASIPLNYPMPPKKVFEPKISHTLAEQAGVVTVKNLIYKAMFGTLAVLFSLGGMLVVLVLAMKIQGAGATMEYFTATSAKPPDLTFLHPPPDSTFMPQRPNSTFLQLQIPSYVDIAGKGNEKDAMMAGSGCGTAWDSCCGMTMFNTTAPFVSWDKNPASYTINGISGKESSKGSGKALVGIVAKNKKVEWHLTDSIYVPSISEPLVAAVWF